jgi:hypothetical protein
MSNWLGIAILLTFSLGASLFMQMHTGRLRKRELPADLGRWTTGKKGEQPPPSGGAPTLESRTLLIEGGLFRRHRLIEQRRLRDANGEIVAILPERVIERWWAP